MACVLRKLPFADVPKEVAVGSVNTTLRPLQIPVWVTLCRHGPVLYDATSPLILAVLDTGFNGGFSIREEQVRKWGGADPQWFPRLRTSVLSRGTVDVRAANIWLHRNIPYSSDAARQGPLRVELDEIHVFRSPDNPQERDSRPELPLLGMRAL